MRMRRRPDGSVRRVYDNRGLRKICACPRRRWSDCSHPWHFNFQWKGATYRFSLDRHLGRRIKSHTEAETEAEKIRVLIRAGLFASNEPKASEPTASALKFRQLADLWTRRYGHQLASARNDSYRLKQINAFELTARNIPTAFGDVVADRMTLLDVDA